MSGARQPAAIDRLVGVFSSAFPELSPDRIYSATTETVSGWDSCMTLTLISLSEEEFGVWIGYDTLERLNSFQAFQDLVLRKMGDT